MSRNSEVSPALRDTSKPRKLTLTEIVALISRRMHGQNGGATILFENGTPRKIRYETYEDLRDLAG